MDEIRNAISQALARAYCAKINEKKVLDPDLIEVMIGEVLAVLPQQPAEKLTVGFGGIPKLVEEFKELSKESQAEVMKQMGSVFNSENILDQKIAEILKAEGMIGATDQDITNRKVEEIMKLVSPQQPAEEVCKGGKWIHFI